VLYFSARRVRLRLRLLPFRCWSAVGRWQMTLFLTAHRRDHRLAVPLTASRSCKVGAAFREGRRHHHDECCLVGLVVVYSNVLCVASPQAGVSSSQSRAWLGRCGA
jgi:hypothetical protein